MKPYTRKTNRPYKKKNEKLELRKLFIENIILFSEVNDIHNVDIKQFGEYDTKRQSIKAFNTHFYSLLKLCHTMPHDIPNSEKLFEIRQKNKDDKNDFSIIIKRVK